MPKLKNFKWLRFILNLSFLWAIITLAFAEAPALSKTKNQIQALDKQIGHLEKTLQAQSNEKTHLLNELATTDKKIGQTWQNLHETQQKTALNKKKIEALQGNVRTQKNALKQQEEMLANHIRTRYQISEYQPAKWLLNQENPEHYSRILTLYQYLLQSRLQLISQLKTTKQKLSAHQTQLEQELALQLHLQQTLTQQHESLALVKTRENTLIGNLEKDLVTKTQQLIEVKQNKDNLSQLLKQLAAQSVAKPRFPIVQMRKKLPRPIANNGISPQRVNQGVTFIAKEGEPVRAVYPGKIVFSDWLNGYGLLVIIDHGQGFMTLYAHNQSLYKHKGEPISQNEQIASVGHSGGRRENGLYFEIRQRGKAIPPLEWLA